MNPEEFNPQMLSANEAALVTQAAHVDQPTSTVHGESVVMTETAEHQPIKDRYEFASQNGIKLEVETETVDARADDGRLYSITKRTLNGDALFYEITVLNPSEHDEVKQVQSASMRYLLSSENPDFIVEYHTAYSHADNKTYTKPFILSEPDEIAVFTNKMRGVKVIEDIYAPHS